MCIRKIRKLSLSFFLKDILYTLFTLLSSIFFICAIFISSQKILFIILAALFLILLIIFTIFFVKRDINERKELNKDIYVTFINDIKKITRNTSNLDHTFKNISEVVTLSEENEYLKSRIDCRFDMNVSDSKVFWVEFDYHSLTNSEIQENNFQVNEFSLNFIKNLCYTIQGNDIDLTLLFFKYYQRDELPGIFYSFSFIENKKLLKNSIIKAKWPIGPYKVDVENYSLIFNIPENSGNIISKNLKISEINRNKINFEPFHLKAKDLVDLEIEFKIN